MFSHKEHKKKSSFLPFVIFRTILSLTMLLILSLGVYQAFRHFSGVDPLRLDPQTIVASVLSSPDIETALHKVLGAKLPGSLDEIKNIGMQGGVGGKDRESSAPVVLRFALVSDSHSDSESLKKALKESKEKGAKFVIGLGDYTEVGTDDELKAVKKIFDSSGLPYYLTAGDHDLWNARDKGAEPADHFIGILGSPYQAFTDSEVRFIILYNSDNYQGMDNVQISWLGEELQRVKNGKYLLSLAFAHEPFYHPSSDHFMGKETQTLISQSGLVTQMLSEAGINEVFFGDVHYFSRYTEPKYDLDMTVVGALTSTRNTQKSRFSLVEVHSDGIYNVRDIELQ